MHKSCLDYYNKVFINHWTYLCLWIHWNNSSNIISPDAIKFLHPSQVTSNVCPTLDPQLSGKNKRQTGAVWWLKVLCWNHESCAPSTCWGKVWRGKVTVPQHYRQRALSHNLSAEKRGAPRTEVKEQPCYSSCWRLHLHSNVRPLYSSSQHLQGNRRVFLVNVEKVVRLMTLFPKVSNGALTY